MNDENDEKVNRGKKHARLVPLSKMDRLVRTGIAAYGRMSYHWRPSVRGECPSLDEEPCPYVGCQYNLYLDVTQAGSIVLNFPELEPEEMDNEASCVLDITDREPAGATLSDVGVYMNLTRERVRQIEVRAKEKVRMEWEE